LKMDSDPDSVEPWESQRVGRCATGHGFEVVDRRREWQVLWLYRYFGQDRNGLGADELALSYWAENRVRIAGHPCETFARKNVHHPCIRRRLAVLC
jgi:hypothetical protein